MKVGVNGAVRDISDLKVGANGAVRAVSEAYIGVNGAVKKVWPTFPVGSVIVLDTVGPGSWECPASGQWEIEIHGGGGGGGYGQRGSSAGGVSGGGGGGSGKQVTMLLEKGTKYSYTIGFGGPAGTRETQPSAGAATRITGIASVDGGYPGGNSETSTGGSAGRGVGELSTYGGRGTKSFDSSSLAEGGAGGYGNKNKPTQRYGNGGKGGDGARVFGPVTEGQPGEDGAIILTYLG